MGRLKRDIARNKLAKVLSIANDEQFLRLIWCTDVIQSGGQTAPCTDVHFPPEAISPEKTSKWRIYGWRLETLINELLATDKKAAARSRGGKVFNCHQFHSLAYVADLLREIEDAEDGISLASGDVLQHIPRIGHRQFEWQSGIATLVDMYRSTRLFAGPKANACFVARHGMSLTDFMKCGFAVYALAQHSPVIQHDVEGMVGARMIGLEEYASALKLLTVPIQQARKMAKANRIASRGTGYGRSVVRDFPCVALESGATIVPLRDLVFWRITSGLYYDGIAEDAGDIRNEFGERFESYCADLFARSWPELSIERESEYQVGKRPFRTPDLRFVESGRIRMVGECKSKRMRLEAKFSSSADEVTEFLAELVKAAVQVWTYFRNVRTGQHVEDRLADDACAVVLSLDPWLQLSHGRYERILLEAAKYAEEKGIREVDRKPIAFLHIDDCEEFVSRGTFGQFRETARLAATDKYAGWHWTSLCEDRVSPLKSTNPYPFQNDVGDLLPWWKVIVLDQRD